MKLKSLLQAILRMTTGAEDRVSMERIGEDVYEQLSIVPRQFFVTRHKRARYACRCKERAKNAPVPTLPLTGAQVIPAMIERTMVSKLLDGLPLYRQKIIAA